ncbi:MAG TPA: hypothetical protein VE988_15300 [Gemmataceae bacterium]|nr:hypothetical protein [Gemmataceae bacterium]
MRFRPALFGFGVPSLLLVIAIAVGQQPTRPPDKIQDRPKDGVQQPVRRGENIVEQIFPPNGIMETAWKVEWDTEIRHGLVIKNAWFKRSPEHDWMQVLGDARVCELFVPYHRGSPRFWDVTQYTFELTRVTADDAGPHGKIHISNNGRATIPCVVEEIKDRGVIWKDNRGVRRGHTMLLWACIDAANYRYLVEYGFQDDGCITFRCGATGHNLGGNEYVPHMHNVYWRVDVNLDGKDYNTAQLMERIEPKQGDKTKADVIHTTFNGGKEGFADWDASKFTMLRVINTQKKNARGENYAYDVMPARMGNSRHFGNGEACTQHDFWVTKADPKEMTYRDLPKYINGENIENTDIVIWYSSPVFHEPRSEDGKIVNGQLWGCTHVGWAGFTFRPSNIFDQTPLYHPYNTGTPPQQGKGKGGFGKKGGGGD